MKISVIIPAFNEAKYLPDTLQAVRSAAEAFSSLNWDWEVIVCDNNSRDRTAELARAGGAQVVFEPVNQISRARNAGAAAATGDWLVFVDADSQPSRGLFSSVADAIQQGDCLAGGATVNLDLPGHWATVANTLWNSISRSLRYMAGSFIFCPTAVFRELGGFSLELYVSEEIELSRRLKKYARKQGKRIVILRDHPLLTSGRKVRLYSLWDFNKFLLTVIFTGKRNLRRRDKCRIWYEGRR